MNNPSQSDHDILIAIQEKVNSIERQLFGNGQPGLRSRVEKLERYKFLQIGGIAVLSMVAGAVLHSIAGN
jgi:hypothetical protein